MQTSHPAHKCKVPFAPASEVLQENAPGALPAFCTALRKPSRGAHELKQHRVPTETFQAFSVLLQFKACKHSPWKGETCLPNATFPFGNPITFLLRISIQVAFVCIQH